MGAAKSKKTQRGRQNNQCRSQVRKRLSAGGESRANPSLKWGYWRLGKLGHDSETFMDDERSGRGYFGLEIAGILVFVSCQLFLLFGS